MPPAWVLCRLSRDSRTRCRIHRGSKAPCKPNSLRDPFRRNMWCTADLHDDPKSAAWWSIRERRSYHPLCRSRWSLLPAGRCLKVPSGTRDTAPGKDWRVILHGDDEISPWLDRIVLNDWGIWPILWVGGKSQMKLLGLIAAQNSGVCVCVCNSYVGGALL